MVVVAVAGLLWSYWFLWYLGYEFGYIVVANQQSAPNDLGIQ